MSRRYNRQNEPRKYSSSPSEFLDKELVVPEFIERPEVRNLGTATAQKKQNDKEFRVAESNRGFLAAIDNRDGSAGQCKSHEESQWQVMGGER